MPLFVPVSAPSNQYIPFLLSRKSSILYSLPASEIFVKNRLLFNTDISLKIFANISIGRIKYMNGINKICTTSIVNSHTDRKAVFP